MQEFATLVTIIEHAERAHPLDHLGREIVARRQVFIVVVGNFQEAHAARAGLLDEGEKILCRQGDLLHAAAAKRLDEA